MQRMLKLLINQQSTQSWANVVLDKIENKQAMFEIIQNKITVTSFSIIIENDKKEILLIKLQHNIFDAVKLLSTATTQSEAVNRQGCCS